MYNNNYKLTYVALHMELVAMIGSDSESWGQLTGLINRGTCDKIILVRIPGSEAYESPVEARELILDSAKPLGELKKELLEKLRPLLSEFEACLSIASGTGKEHMALISALLSIPVGIRLTAFTKSGVEFIN